MIMGKNINIRAMSSSDLELIYSWNTSQTCMGDYMQAELLNKEVYIESMKKALAGNGQFFLVIENKAGEPVGILNYFSSASSNISIDFGIMIPADSNRGKGVGKEAVSLLVDYLFQTKNIMRIQYLTRTDNDRMKSLGQKLGFTMEAILRKYRFDMGEYRDLCLFSITRDDWKQLREKVQ